MGRKRIVNLSENRWKWIPLVARKKEACPTCGGGISEIAVKLTIPLKEMIYGDAAGPQLLIKSFIYKSCYEGEDVSSWESIQIRRLIVW